MNCLIKTPSVDIFFFVKKAYLSSDENLLMRKIGFIIKGILIVMPIRPQNDCSQSYLDVTPK